jgi:uncharacterized protein (TIGR03643 family)
MQRATRALPEGIPAQERTTEQLHPRYETRPAPADNPRMAKTAPRLDADTLRRVIATAWEDRPPYDRVMREHGIGPGELAALLKRELTPTAYKQWVAQGKAAKAPTKRSVWPHGR